MRLGCFPPTVGLPEAVLYPTVSLPLDPPTPTVTLEGAGLVLMPTLIEGPGGNMLGDVGGGGVFCDRPTPTVGGDLVTSYGGSKSLRAVRS